MSTADATAPQQFRKFRRDQEAYRRIFVEAHGPFPHPCYFCGETVEPWSGRFDRLAPVVHHVDHDQTNNDPANLAPAHNGCHVGYHSASRVWTPEALANLSAGIKRAHAEGRILTPEARAKISAAGKGRTKSAETRAKLSAAQKGRKPSPETRAKLSAAIEQAHAAGRILTPEARAKIAAAALEGYANGRVRHWKGKTFSPEHRANISAAAKDAPRVSCVRCHRELSVRGLHLHLRACRADRDAA